MFLLGQGSDGKWKQSKTILFKQLQAISFDVNVTFDTDTFHISLSHGTQAQSGNHIATFFQIG